MAAKNDAMAVILYTAELQKMERGVFRKKIKHHYNKNLRKEKERQKAYAEKCFDRIKDLMDQELECEIEYEKKNAGRNQKHAAQLMIGTKHNFLSSINKVNRMFIRGNTTGMHEVSASYEIWTM